MRIMVKYIGMPAAPEWQIEATPVSRDPGGELIPIDLPEHATVVDLTSRLRAEPDKILVNGNDATSDTPLHEGDAIALIGPAAGKE